MCFELRHTDILVFSESMMTLFSKFFENVVAKTRGPKKLKYGFRQAYDCRMSNKKHGNKPMQDPRQRQTSQYVEGTCKVKVCHFL
jgi:hypothetical protein